jgi:hypothetical protein
MIFWISGLPCLVIIGLAPTILVPRLFLPLLFLLLLWFTKNMHRALKTKGNVRNAAAAIVACVCIANAVQLTTFVRYGHWRYVHTLQYIVDHDGSDHVTVASNSGLRIEKLLWFYEPRLVGSKSIQYVGELGHLAQLPTWLLLEHTITQTPPRLRLGETVYDRLDNALEPGDFWALYRKE